MRIKVFSMAIVLGLLFSVIPGVQLAMANNITWPAEPQIDDPSGPTGDAPGIIDVSKVYVTHDSQKLYVDVQGPTIIDEHKEIRSRKLWYAQMNRCYIYLNDLEVMVYDSDPELGLILTSTYGSVEAPCMVTIPLSELGDATEICIWVKTEYAYFRGSWHNYDDYAPDDGNCETYYITIQPSEKTVEIDIKPRSFPNSINPDSKGVIPTAILTAEDFDASTVDVETVRFGPDDSSPVHYAIEDVDNDGDYDMILHFKTEETGIAAGDTEAILTAKTSDGTDIVGTDSVRTVPPKGKK